MVATEALGRAPMERIPDRTCLGGFTAGGVRTVYGIFVITRAGSNDSRERRGRSEGRRDARGTLVTERPGQYPGRERCEPPKRVEAA